jgi:TetR/AcrR family transcriptional repressor of nem operon
MRKSKDETARTRRHIVDTAAVEFRRGGIAGTGVADIMGAAGLTQGGFYRHFDSKDALVQESLGSSMDALRATIEESMTGRSGRAGVLAAIDDYLSVEHRDSTSPCPFVSLGSELAREDSAVRDAATAGLRRLAELIARQLTGVSPGAAKNKALVIVSTMIGAMTVARLVPDRALSTLILAQARKSLAEQVRQAAP